ncbi:MAG: hypothetical protein HYU54_07925 [Actinobacteria bacterium]|nr:hypothetical protein [Actinomycetota bacterium]
MALLLRHLWATDGSVSVRRSGPGAVGRIYFASSSRALADDVATLLLRFGVVARIRSVRSGASRPWFTVDVSGARDMRRFLDLVGSFGPRRDPAEQLRRVLGTVEFNTNVDTLPSEVFGQVLEAMEERGVSARAMASMRGVTSAGVAHVRFSPSRALLAEYADILDDDGLREWAESDLFWDRVVRVGSDSEECVFDITVPEPTTWISGSTAIISHNSGAIEQDSDVVMFIHRDDTDPSKKGVADLIVAKHRNGPTDTIPLTFLPHLTQFRNYAPGS